MGKKIWTAALCVLVGMAMLVGCVAPQEGPAVESAPRPLAVEESYAGALEGGAAEEAPSGGGSGAPSGPGGDYGPSGGLEGEIVPYPVPEQDGQGQAGILTAGEWRDNDNWTYFRGIINDQDVWSEFQTKWCLYPSNRIHVKLSNGVNAVENARVTLYGDRGSVLWQAVSDNNGDAYLFYDIFGDRSEKPETIEAVTQSDTTRTPVPQNALLEPLQIQIQGGSAKQKTLDLLIMCDTTGSMSDELCFLQTELEDMLSEVQRSVFGLSVRLSVNFYRDKGDAYVLRDFPFTTDIGSAVEALNQQDASGGGDYEEAVDLALESAVCAHDWSEQTSAKLMFLILDAPPHHADKTVARLQDTVREAARLGIRIIPIAASGIDTETEYLMRVYGISTGGTYIFLTDDSGVGNDHLEPTISDYTVEYLNRLMIRVISGYIA